MFSGGSGKETRLSFAKALEVLLTERLLALGLVGAVFVQCALAWLSVPAYRCPFHLVLGLPCPGCGLTRGIQAMLHGQWVAMWDYHPFTPYVVLLGIMTATSSMLSAQRRQRLARAVAGWEARTHVNAIMLIGMLVFGLARLARFWIGAEC